MILSRYNLQGVIAHCGHYFLVGPFFGQSSLFGERFFPLGNFKHPSLQFTSGFHFFSQGNPRMRGHSMPSATMKVRVSEWAPITSPRGSMAKLDGTPSTTDLSSWQNTIRFFNLLNQTPSLSTRIGLISTWCNLSLIEWLGPSFFPCLGLTVLWAGLLAQLAHLPRDCLHSCFWASPVCPPMGVKVPPPNFGVAWNSTTSMLFRAISFGH